MTSFKTILRIVTRILYAAIFFGLLYLSIQVTQPDLNKLVTSGPKAKNVLSQLFSPDLMTREATKVTIAQPIPVPCGSIPNPEPATEGARIMVDPQCGEPMAKVNITGIDLPKNADVSIRWILPNGQAMSVKNAKTDAKGNLVDSVELRPIIATTDGVAGQIALEVSTPKGQLFASPTLKDVLDSMFVTIFMALIATTLGTIIAVPLSFLAASNITRRGPVGSTVYYIVRAFLNIIRSYEPLVLATIFALIVGYGSPFAGVLALSITTAASLGKMFSESVEGIDPGPIEALTATGANRLLVVSRAVVPQIVPDFLSFIIYHWDINVRLSTIIGFVGGGGIGYLLSQRISTLQYSQAGTALLAIIIVVWVLDFLSSEIRKQLV
jgi:phosphonate transport system permease protein